MTATYKKATPGTTYETELEPEEKQQSREEQLQQLLFRLGVAPLPESYNELISLSELKLIEVSDSEKRAASKLSRSIQILGRVLNPVQVEERREGGYTVISGRRRVLAAEIAGLSELEAVVYPPLTPSQRQMLTLSENLVRSPNPRLELREICGLVEKGIPLTHKELAMLFSISHITAQKYLKLTTLPTPLLKGILEGELAISLGISLSQLPLAAQAKASEIYLEEGSLSSESVKQLRQAQVTHTMSPLQKLLAEQSDNDWQEPEYIEGQEPEVSPFTTETTGGELEEMVKGMLRLKGYVNRRYPGRPARQIEKFIEAILSELEGLK